jgi:serine/threonine protein kinase
MELKSGSVQYLIEEHQFFETTPAIAYILLFQMLKALDCLANEGMIHRDVKPENILFTPLSSGDYLYQLADFGLANMAANAQTYAGTEPYMAPEVYSGSGQPQTVKMDIWSLFVTAAYAMNAAGYRRKPRRNLEQVLKAVGEAAMWPRLQMFHEMASENPDDRATAGDMLDKVFHGRGRTTS